MISELFEFCESFWMQEPGIAKGTKYTQKAVKKS